MVRWMGYGRGLNGTAISKIGAGLLLILLVVASAAALAAEPGSAKLLYSRERPDKSVLKVTAVQVNVLAEADRPVSALRRIEVTLTDAGGESTLLHARLSSTSEVVHDVAFHQGQLAVLSSDETGDMKLTVLMPTWDPLSFRIDRNQWDRSAVSRPFSNTFKPKLAGGPDMETLRVEMHDNRWPESPRTFIWRPARDWSRLEQEGKPFATTQPQE